MNRVSSFKKELPETNKYLENIKTTKNAYSIARLIAIFCSEFYGIKFKGTKERSILIERHFDEWQKKAKSLKDKKLDILEKIIKPKKILLAIENLKKILAPKGKIVVTLSLGENPEMDKLIKTDKIKFSKKFCLKRVSANNKWVEVDWEDIKDLKYNKPFPCANGLIVGEII